MFENLRKKNKKKFDWKKKSKKNFFLAALVSFFGLVLKIAKF